MFTASETSIVCESQLLHACEGLFFTNFCCNTKKTLEKSLLDPDQLSNVNKSSNFGKGHHSASSIAARVKKWKSDIVFYEHLSIKKRPVFEAVQTENNLIPFMFHLQWMKEKQRKRAIRFLFLQEE